MQTDFLFDPPAPRTVPVTGDTRAFPVRRIFCVGRNYAAHAVEMGNEVDRENPFYFTKCATAICPSGSTIAYPAGTTDCHFEMEFVVALGRGGQDVSQARASELVLGYACGIDLTRRDLQSAAKDRRRPWDLGKDFDNSAVIAPISRVSAFGVIGSQRLHLSHDGTIAQEAFLSDMIWTVPEIISDLSRFYSLAPGDLIYTGTPAGVGPVQAGSELKGGIEGLAPVHLRIAAPD
ncbi:fumarylacetoacetate hydrolase family protein [Roseovarius salis]|uniref:fumarylacetoacetate hydrolase family protein n=1 Tax=Roseovarius salis TaxID=3376063 RepID=UPI0037C8D52B